MLDRNRKRESHTADSNARQLYLFAQPMADWASGPRRLEAVRVVAEGIREVRSVEDGALYLEHTQRGAVAHLRAEVRSWRDAARLDTRVLPLVDWGELEGGDGVAYLTPAVRPLAAAAPLSEAAALRVARSVAGAAARMGGHGNVSARSVFLSSGGGALLGGWGAERQNGDDVRDVARLVVAVVDGGDRALSAPLRKVLRQALDDGASMTLAELRYDLAAVAGQLPVCSRALPPPAVARRSESLLKADLNSVNGSNSHSAAEMLGQQRPTSNARRAAADPRAAVATPVVVAPVGARSNAPAAEAPALSASDAVAAPSPTSVAQAALVPIPAALSQGVEEVVSKLVEPALEANDADMLTALAVQTTSHPGLVEKVFKTLFKRPLGKNPIVGLKGLHLLHVLQREGAPVTTALTVQHDGFLGWLESLWTRERIQSRPAHKAHRLSHCFAVGELAWYAAFLRKRAAFFAAYPTHFSPRWAVHPEARAYAAKNHLALRAALGVLEGAAVVLKRVASAGDPAAEVKRCCAPTLVTDVAYAYRACCWLYATANTQLRRPMTDDLDAAHFAARIAFRVVAAEPAVMAIVPANVVLQLEESPPRNFDVAPVQKKKKSRRKKVDTVSMQDFQKKSATPPADEGGDKENEEVAASEDDGQAVAEKQTRRKKKSGKKRDDGADEEQGAAYGDADADEEEESSVDEAKRGKKSGKKTEKGERKAKAAPRRKAPDVVPATNGKVEAVEESREGSKEAIAAAAQGKKTPAINAAFEVAPYEVQFGQQIGSGGFGVVYKAQFRGRTVAVKKIHAHALRNAGSVSEFQSEVAVLCTLKHPNILAFYGACTRPPNLMIITEFMANGTLFDVLHQSQRRVTWPMRRRLALDTCRGMRYLHDSKLLHRDLKSSNLMLDEKFNCKVGDFGLTRTSAGANNLQMTGQCGTFQYMAVEVLANRPYSEKADVFSFGVLLWEMVARKLPYFGMQPMQVGIAVVQQGLRPTMPPNTPPPLVRLIKACWDNDPAKRPSFAQLVTMLEAMPE